MSATKLSYLFYRYFDRTATEEEKNTFIELLASPENEQEIQRLMEESWDTFHSDRKRIGDEKSLELLQAALRSRPAGAAGPLAPGFTDPVPGAVHVIPIHSLPRQAKLFTWPRVAAAAIILLSIAGLYRYGGRHMRDGQVVQSPTNPDVNGDPVAYIQQRRLPDGSTVILHANSHLEYPSNFSDSAREVTLTGEAYFDIVHETARPFIIHTGGVKTTVLGTAFNIKAYPGAMKVVVSVTQGKVKVENGARLLAVLTPDQQVIYTIPADKVEEQKVDAESVVTDWTHEDMIFEGSSFEAVADVLSRRYGVSVNFKNPKLRKCMIKAYFKGTEPLSKVLEVLCTISNTHYTRDDRDDRKVTLDGPGCD